MNKTEALAHAWLRRQGYTEDEIVFRRRMSPDFLTADGKGWEVKLAREWSVLFTRGQVDSLRDHPDTTILIWKDDGEEPAEVWPACDLSLPSYQGRYRLAIEGASGVQIRVSAASRRVATIRAAFEDMTLEAWITRAILAQAEREETARR